MFYGERKAGALAVRDLEGERRHIFAGAYLAVDGPGSSGKDALLRTTTWDYLPALIPDFRETYQIYQLQEPPDWSQFREAGTLTPYEIITQGLIANEAEATAIMAWRRMQWGGASLDGEVLEDGLWETLNSPRGIVLGNR